jgi:hypothetical protein
LISPTVTANNVTITNNVTTPITQYSPTQHKNKKENHIEPN